MRGNHGRERQAAYSGGKKVSLLRIWDAVEADFQRDYGMDLLRELDYMSWRRFQVLLRHLSPFGAVARALEEERARGAEGQEAAAAFFEGMAGVRTK